MTELQLIALQLTAIFKRKFISKVTGMSNDQIDRLRQGRFKPRNESLCQRLKALYEMAKGNTWI